MGRFLCCLRHPRILHGVHSRLKRPRTSTRIRQHTQDDAHVPLGQFLISFRLHWLSLKSRVPSRPPPLNCLTAKERLSHTQWAYSFLRERYPFQSEQRLSPSCVAFLALTLKPMYAWAVTGEGSGPPHEEDGGGIGHRAWPWIATPRNP